MEVEQLDPHLHLDLGEEVEPRVEMLDLVPAIGAKVKARLAWSWSCTPSWTELGLAVEPKAKMLDLASALGARGRLAWAGAGAGPRAGPGSRSGGGA